MAQKNHLLEDFEAVDISPHGTFKYVLIEATDENVSLYPFHYVVLEATDKSVGLSLHYD